MSIDYDDILLDLTFYVMIKLPGDTETHYQVI